MLVLDRKTKSQSTSYLESLHGTLNWLLRAQDATPDPGVSTGYSLALGWLKSYPETTGYILQTFIRHYALFGEEMLLDRAQQMAEWEVEVQWKNGGIPGSWGTSTERPVAFNTGQVLLGWAELLKFVDSPHIKDAAARAGYWLMECMSPEGYFEKGLSEASDTGKLSHNAMVSWGLMELASVLADDKMADAAIRSAHYYAQTVDSVSWPVMSGIDGSESDYPLTHALGYTVQGLLETGLLGQEPDLVNKAHNILKAARDLIKDNGFFPGRIHKNWQGGASWVCLTGSAQFACCMLRLAQQNIDTNLIKPAQNLIDFVVQTQISDEQMMDGIRFGVRGSYPFHRKGYCRVTYVNWAAKFHLDALHLLQQLKKIT